MSRFEHFDSASCCKSNKARHIDDVTTKAIRYGTMDILNSKGTSKEKGIKINEMARHYRTQAELFKSLL